jgi:hypothetical protein
MATVTIANNYPPNWPNFNGSSNRDLQVKVNTTLSTFASGQTSRVVLAPNDTVQVTVPSYLTDFSCAATSSLAAVTLTDSNSVQTGGFGIQFTVGDAISWPVRVRIPLITSPGCSEVETASSPTIGYFECTETAITFNVNAFDFNSATSFAGAISVACPQQPSYASPSLNGAVSNFNAVEVPDNYCITLTVASKVFPLEDNVSPVITFGQAADCSSGSWLPPVTLSSQDSVWQIPYSGNDSADGFFLSYKLFAETQFTVTPSSITAAFGLPSGYDTLGFEYETFGSPPQNYLNPTTSFFGNTNGVTLFPGLIFTMPISVVQSTPWYFSTSVPISENSNTYTFLRNPNSESPYGMMLAAIFAEGVYLLDVVLNGPDISLNVYESSTAPTTTNSEWGAILSTSYEATDLPTSNIADAVYLCVRIANKRYLINPSFTQARPLDGQTPPLDLVSTPGFARTNTGFLPVQLTLLSSVPSLPSSLDSLCWNPTVYGCNVSADENPDSLPLCTLAAAKPLSYPFLTQNRCMPSSSTIMSQHYVAAADNFLVNRCAVIYDEPTLCKPVVGTQQNTCTGFGMRSLGASCQAACGTVQQGIVYDPNYENITKAPCANGTINCGNGLGRCDEIQRMLCSTDQAKNLGDCSCLNAYESTFPNAVRGNQSFSSFQNSISSLYGITANLALNPECFWDTCDLDQGIITSVTRKNCPESVTDCVAFLRNINLAAGPSSLNINIQNTCGGSAPASNSSFCNTLDTFAANSPANPTTSYLVNYFFPPPAPPPGATSSTGFILDGPLGTFDYIAIAIVALIDVILLGTAALTLARVLQSKRAQRR